MGSRGDAYDRRLRELHRRIKVESIKRHRYGGRNQARLSIFT